jgi:hypothetical protein
MSSLRTFTAGAVSLTILATGSMNALAEAEVYADFPVTVKGYDGDAKSSVSYSGQIARHILHDSLKKLIGADLPENEKYDRLMAYYAGKSTGRAIIAPKSAGAFKIKQTDIDAVSGGKNLSGKTAKYNVTGMPRAMSGKELVTFWLTKAAATKNGVDLQNGYDYAQLVSKYVMGAVSFNQVVDHYLDEGLGPKNKPNDQAYKKGQPYTGKEHVWDEAFGYFGAPAHSLSLSATDIYNIAKRGKKSKDPAAIMARADHNGDGVVDLKTEMVFGPAYYAAAFDKSAEKAGVDTNYTHEIFKAFVAGRKIITAANGAKLSDKDRAALVALAAKIETTWQTVLAEAVFKYAGAVLKDMSKLQVIVDANGDTKKQFAKYVKHWGELKGFSLALQLGRKDLGETAAKLNRLIGAGPLLLNASQVVDIDRSGNYLRDQGETWVGYMVHMAKIQRLMVSAFAVKVKANDATSKLSRLVNAAGGGGNSEND